MLLLNPSSASAGLKQSFQITLMNPNRATKPFFGFGWIETCLRVFCTIKQASTKPFFGFGWIETRLKIEYFKRQVATKPFFGFGWIETLLTSLLLF